MKEILSILKVIENGLKAMAKGIDAVAAKAIEISKEPAKVRKAVTGPARKAKPKAKSAKKAPAVNTVFEIIRDSEQAIDTAALIEKTGFERKKIANIVFKLKKQGKIASVSKGAYKAS
jgi:citrate lyase beta subunit